jgi:hypothetical protein
MRILYCVGLCVHGLSAGRADLLSIDVQELVCRAGTLLTGADYGHVGLLQRLL